MAEIAGLALGVVGLAGLIGAFKDTIDLFGMVADSRHLGRQYEILDTKFDIEKMLLLQWADRVRLLNPDYDKRLDDIDTRNLVTRILSSVRSLMTDTGNLQERYGLCPEQPNSLRRPSNTQGHPSDAAIASSTSIFQATDRISHQRMERFISDFQALCMRNDIRGKALPIHRRARWVIRDRNKFEVLVGDLGHFVTKLSELVPATTDSTSATALACADLADIKEDIAHLKLVLESSSGRRPAIANSTQEAILQARRRLILNTLWFRRIDDRRESIEDAHKKTLHWALNPPDSAESYQWHDLSAWLREGSGLYWVSGKAGSGKSTLMKYLYQRPHTGELLWEWAHGPYVICNYFFSNLGSKEQNTQEGLSRTLLYQILSNTPSLIEDALPHMWKEVLDTEPGEIGSGTQIIRLPSVAETRHAFEIIVQRSSHLPRLCFFIDGLDEFVGDCMAGISLLLDLAKHEHIKIVVSSRPEPAYVAAFDKLPHLRLQDLTHGDIQSYVEDVVGGHPSLKTHMTRSPEKVASLLTEIAEKSSGVFLWVKLACRSILDGFADYDHLSELASRIELLPPELEDMFAYMLRKIPKRHRQQAAAMLRTCYCHYESRGSSTGGHGLLALGLALVDDYSSNPVSFNRLTNRERAELCLEVEGRLRSRCGGLLELSTKVGKFSYIGLWQRDDEENKKVLYPLANARVVFMHRTVFEFLANEHVWAELPCLSTGRKFRAQTALSLYCMHIAMQLIYLKDYEKALDFFRRSCWWGSKAVSHQARDHIIIFDHVQPFLDAWPENKISNNLVGISNIIMHERAQKCCSLSLLVAVEAGATIYVKTHPDFPKLAHEGGTHSVGLSHILCHALRPDIMLDSRAAVEIDASERFLYSAEMVRLLITQGSDPNRVVVTVMGKETTPWSIWLDQIKLLEDLTRIDFSSSNFNNLLEITELLLERGADIQPVNFGSDGVKSLMKKAFIELCRRHDILIDQVLKKNPTWEVRSISNR
ncbi:prion-inhibition and propagation-domain-containing protein [Bombardia bombarda]|uniref:Prion-inhibition and propagation-domain-containing protein n=1 Tax=Bombardia bombarda TaxID=252184 RepID=A0AA40C9I7_9PEZI|nr:prion-inhibition and propagation-domain-containing protein [Bombardia bombarda]